MTQTTPGPITFWFDFGSPYSWLASTQVEATARRCGRTLQWRAILLGVIFRTTGMAPLGEQRLRGDYARHDVARIARYMGLPCVMATPPPGTPSPSPGCSTPSRCAMRPWPRASPRRRSR
jgi:2-hydroxychromene-2-carboxylate isomerase